MSPPAKHGPKQQEASTSTVSEEMQSILQHITTIEKECRAVKRKLHDLPEFKETSRPKKKISRVLLSRASKDADGGRTDGNVKGEIEEKKARNAEKPADETERESEEEEEIERKLCERGCGTYLEADASPSWVNCKMCRREGTTKWDKTHSKRDSRKKKKKDDKEKEKTNKKKAIEEEKGSEQNGEEDGDKVKAKEGKSGEKKTQRMQLVKKRITDT